MADDALLLNELAAGDRPDRRQGSGGRPGRRSGAGRLREWLRVAHPPDLATVERVLSVASGSSLAADIGEGRSVRRSQGRLRIEPPPQQA